MQNGLDVASVNSSKPTLALKAYQGLYKSELYGNALVTVKGKKVNVKLLHTAIWDGTVSTYDADTFLIEFEKVTALPQGFITFTLDDEKQKVESFVIDVPNPDFDFTEFNFVKLDWVEMKE